MNASIIRQRLNAYRSKDRDSKAFDLTDNGDYILNETDDPNVLHIDNYEGGGVFNPDIYKEREEIAEFIRKFPEVGEVIVKEIDNVPNAVRFVLKAKELVRDSKPAVKIDQEDVDFLIEDEEEAIDGYKDVLEHVTDKDQVKVLKSIIADEKRHIKMIKALLK